VESTIGTSAVLKIRTGSVPATCATADSGTVLATCTLPSDWMAAASGGTKSLSGTWQDTSADATGTAAWVRVRDGAGNACFDADVSVTGGSGTVQMPTTSITSGGPIAFNSFTIKMSPGAW